MVSCAGLVTPLFGHIRDPRPIANRRQIDNSPHSYPRLRTGPDDSTKDPDVIKVLDAADSSNDGAVRKADYAAALKRISEQAYWAPLFSYSTNYAFTSDLNFKAYPDELPRFYEASWK